VDQYPVEELHELLSSNSQESLGEANASFDSDRLMVGEVSQLYSSVLEPTAKPKLLTEVS